jgi:hypothetical protein
MIDYTKIMFPCEAEYKNSELWEQCLVMGLACEGSSVQPLRSIVNFWIVVDSEGTVKKIHQLHYVRFDRYRVSS